MGVGVNFRPCSEGNFLTGCLWAGSSSLAYKKILGSDAQNNRVIGIDWKEFVLDAMATTVCNPHQMHLGKNKGNKYTLLWL